MEKEPTVLVTGATGMLGRALVYHLLRQTNYSVVGVARRAWLAEPHPRYTHLQGDLADQSFTRSLVAGRDSLWVVHTAGYVDVDGSETNHSLPTSVHIRATQWLSDAASVKRFIYISTDSVYDGAQGNYTESDLPNPINFYAKTKWEGEVAALRHPNSVSLRCTLYGYHSPWSTPKASLFEWGYENLKNNQPIPGFTDVLMTPISMHQLSRVVRRLLDNQLTRGILNVGSQETLSKFDFLNAIATKMKWDPALIQPRILQSVKLVAPRPKNTSLNTSRFTDMMKETLRFDDGLNELLDSLRSET